MKIDERTPLAWPEGFPRTERVNVSAFAKHSLPCAIDEIVRQLNLMRPTVEECILTANGFLRATPKDAGVAVYFKVRTSWDSKLLKYNTVTYVVPCDRWNTLEHNFWAVAKHLEAMRGQRRWGCGSLERDFAGYKALPERSEVKGQWFEVLGVPPNPTWERVQEGFRDRAKLLHADTGGSHEVMVALNKAYEEAKKIFNR